MLIGTKRDIGEARRQVSAEMGQQLADKCGIAFVEVSAKTNEGILDAVTTLVEAIVDHRFGCLPIPHHVPSQESLAHMAIIRPQSLNTSLASSSSKASCRLQ